MQKNIDLNKASAQDMERIPVVGRDQARKIFDYRTQNGEFQNWEDVKKVPGITNELLDTLKRNGFTLSGKAA